MLVLRSLAVALAAALFLAGPAADVASAQTARRIVVERFRGARGAHARSLLVRNLGDAGYEIVSDDEVDGAMRELGLSGTLDATDYVTLARQLHAIAFVDGRVTRARRAWRLTVRVRNGFDGAVLGSEGWGGRTQSAIDGVGRGAADRLQGFFDQARAPATAAVVPPDGETPWYAGGADEERAAEADEEEEPPPPVDSSTRYDSFRISLSGGSLWRSMQTTAEVYAARRGMAPADPATALVEEPRGYTSSGIGHAELGVESEFFPGALGDQPFPYLGLLISFRHSAFLTSAGCRRTSADCLGDGRISVGTDQLDLQVGARFRYRVGPSRRDVQIFGEVLYGLSTFTFDLEAMQELDFQAIVPPMEYQWVALGLGLDYGIVPDALFLQVRGGYRIGAGIGTQTRNVWGVESTAGGGFNLGIELKHEANWLVEGIFVSLRFEYFAFFTTFRGQVGCAVPGGCPDIGATPWTDDHLWELWPVRAGSTDVEGGIHDGVNDNYFRWGLYVGYAFR